MACSRWALTIAMTMVATVLLAVQYIQFTLQTACAHTRTDSVATLARRQALAASPPRAPAVMPPPSLPLPSPLTPDDEPDDKHKLPLLPRADEAPLDMLTSPPPPVQPPSADPMHTLPPLPLLNDTLPPHPHEAIPAERATSPPQQRMQLPLSIAVPAALTIISPIL